MISNGDCTLFRAETNPESGGITYRAEPYYNILWQEETAVSAEKRGFAPKKLVRVFLPLEAEAALGDKMARGLHTAPPDTAWTVVDIYPRDFGSAAVQHKEVRCQ